MHSIKDYYIIGDLHSAALVSNDASIDWLCLPHFDSPSIFARLLDDNGGSFSVAKNDFTISSSYIKDTAIVAHTFTRAASTFTLHDFMVPQPTDTTDTHFLIRKFKGAKGVSHITLSFTPKANYAQDSFSEDKALEKLIPALPDSFGVTTAVVLKTEKETVLLYLPRNAHIIKHDDSYEIHLTILEGETQSIVMEYASMIASAVRINREFEAETISFWREWVAKGTYVTFCREALVRSAITLKLMQFYPTGALVAAPTTSLPEELGGAHNWDYRYVWIRDATFTLYAFYVLGYEEEAEKFFAFIQSILEKGSKDDFSIALMYTIEGNPVPNEYELDHFKGYRDSQPVRVGNGANVQFQLDVYGALIDSYYFISKRMMKIHYKQKDLILKLAQKIEEDWMKKDNGIWEVRSGPQHFTYSKVMAWVGINRILRMKKKLTLDAQQIAHYEALEKEIADWIWANCYDPTSKTFQQYPGSPLQDATNFLLVLLQFLDKHDPKTKKILEKTCQELCVDDVFVYRYLRDDGLPRGEGAFLLCTFWHISALAIIEEVDTAGNYFNTFRKYIAHHELLPEEIDMKTKDYLGNYPQAFSHLGFIMTAYYIDRYKNKKE